MIGSIPVPWWVGSLYFLGYIIGIMFCYTIIYWAVVFMKDPGLFKQTIALLWPFGEWDVFWKNREGKINYRDMLIIKEDAVNYYFRYKNPNLLHKDVWIQKIGGFLDGIKVRPRNKRK